MIRAKICGITRVDDALYAAKFGADAIGLVFYKPSPRNISIETAKQVINALPAFVTTVGLFVDPDSDFVQSVLSDVPLDLLQFHGDETASFCEQFSKPYIKAIRMRPDTDLVQCCQTFSGSRGILLDTYVAGTPGGTGQCFDWRKIPQQLPKPIILAGGLTPSNVIEAIKVAKPWAVDTSGGVESSKGIKDPSLMQAFMKGVKSVS